MIILTHCFLTIHKRTLRHRCRPQPTGLTPPLLFAIPNMAGITLVVSSSHEVCVLELNNTVQWRIWCTTVDSCCKVSHVKILNLSICVQLTFALWYIFTPLTFLTVNSWGSIEMVAFQTVEGGHFHCPLIYQTIIHPPKSWMSQFATFYVNMAWDNWAFQWQKQKCSYLLCDMSLSSEFFILSSHSSSAV